jgi:transcriptional regulator with GAF, ATPase, and Fis domain
MSSEIERALARKGGGHIGLHSTSTRHSTSLEHDALGPLLEMNRALSASAGLADGLRDALEALNRYPTIVRSAVTLSTPRMAEIVVDGAPEALRTGRGRGEHSFVCTTVVMEGRPVGALAVDLHAESETVRERTEQLLHAAAELIAHALTLRHVLDVLDSADSAERSRTLDGGGGAWAGAAAADDQETRNAEDEAALPEGGSLADLVSRYERTLIEDALRATRGNRARAAKLLRTTERIVGYRVQQYGINCRLYRG